jgi:hypothetical protein
MRTVSEMRAQAPPILYPSPRANPVVPLEMYDAEPTERFVADGPIELAIAKYYYDRDWKVSRITTRSIDGNEYPYFAFISRFDENLGETRMVPIGWIPGDLPSSEQMRRERMDYGENRMAGPLGGKGELWITHFKGQGTWTAERWELFPPSATPRWRRAETIEFSTTG